MHCLDIDVFSFDSNKPLAKPPPCNFENVELVPEVSKGAVTVVLILIKH